MRCSIKGHYETGPRDRSCALEGLLPKLVEIDENLQRAELSPAQRAATIARRKEVWEALHPESSRRNPPTGKAGYGNPPHAAKSFATDTMEKTGESDRRTREHLSRAAALGPDLHAVVGTSLDKAGELDALKDMEPEARRELIDRAKAGEKVTAKGPVLDKDPQVASRLVIFFSGRSRLAPGSNRGAGSGACCYES